MKDLTLVQIFDFMTTEDLTGRNGEYYWGYSVFNNESNDEDDEREVLYSEDGVKLLVCHEWGYFEILGLEREDYIKVKEAYQSYIKLRRGLNPVTPEEEEEEDIWDNDDDDYSSNCPCDTYGFCGGTSCPQYWQCHSK